MKRAATYHSLHVQSLPRISGGMKRMFALFALAAFSFSPAATAQGRDAPDWAGQLVPVQGQPWTNQFSPGQARDAVRDGKTVPLSRIFQNLRRDHGGYQLGAELYSRGDGTTYYEIDWMTEDGRKVKFTVDAQTGRFLDRRGG
jgi:hypothetical protein